MKSASLTVEHADERERKRPKFLPEEMTDAEVHDLEFTIAISSESKEQSEEAPMLDALTYYREAQHN